MLVLQAFPQIVSAHSSFLSFSVFSCCQRTVSRPSPAESGAHSGAPQAPHGRALWGARALRMAPVSPQVSWHSRPVLSGTFWHWLREPALLRASATGSGAISSRRIEVEGKDRMKCPPVKWVLSRYTEAVLPSLCTVILSPLYCHPLPHSLGFR